MKKALFVFAILFLTLTSVKGQTNVYHPFPDSNAIWHHFFSEGYSTIDSISYSLGLNGDTVINSRVYSKIYYLNDTALTANAQYWGCFREDSLKRVFYLGKDYWAMNIFTDEIQLYDFGKNVGDSINYGIWGKWPIEAIDSVLVGQHYRKRFKVLWDYFIEGIGSVDQFLSPITNVPTKYFTNWDLICFKQNNEVLYIGPEYSTCFYSYRISENTAILNTFSISPNPFSQSTQITLPQTYHNIALAIYDIQGKLVVQNQYKDCSQIQLNRNQLSNGLYFLKLTLDDKEVETRKIVVDAP